MASYDVEYSSIIIGGTYLEDLDGIGLGARPPLLLLAVPLARGVSLVHFSAHPEPFL
jgi:hypothetical protein